MSANKSIRSGSKGATHMPNKATAILMMQLSVYPAESVVSESKTMQEALMWLKGKSMIEPDGTPTAKGRHWVEHVTQLPLPVSKEAFYIPGTTEEE